MVTRGTCTTVTCAFAGMVCAAKGNTTGVVICALGVAAGAASVIAGHNRREKIFSVIRDVILDLEVLVADIPGHSSPITEEASSSDAPT